MTRAISALGGESQTRAGVVRSSGFSLMEVLVALAVMSLLFGAIGGTLTNLLVAQRNVEAKLGRERVGSSILEAIGRDLNGVYAYEIAGAFLGTDSGDQDRLEFISTRPPSFLQDEEEGGSSAGGAFGDPSGDQPVADGPVALKLIKVGYFVQSSESGNGFLTLFRYEDRFEPPPRPAPGERGRSTQAKSPFDNLTDDVASMEVYDRIRSFSVRYLDPEGNYRDNWDEEVIVPLAVEITIEVVPGIEALQRDPDASVDPIVFQTAFGLPISVPDPEDQNRRDEGR